MRTQRSTFRGGQALVMVTLGLFAMSGLMGLAVDLGWSFFSRKAAQSAADAAALAAVNQAMDSISSGALLSCGTGGLGCLATPTSCGGATTGNLQNACQYAQQNGFTAGGDGGRQNVQVSAGITSPPPTVPGVNVLYWVTVRVTNQIPQLFSAIQGNANALASARATAAIVDTVVNGSLIGLDRQNDTGPNGPGVDVMLAGSAAVTAPNGILLASNISGAGTHASGITVTSPFTWIRRGGSVSPAGSDWPYVNQGDGAPFYDPMRNMGQPPLTSSPLPAIPVPAGTLSAGQCPGGVCPPGAYFATGPNPSCPSTCPAVATGDPVVININNFPNASFSAGGNSFGDYVFFGGLSVNYSQVSFGPGRYVMAGVLNASSSVLAIGTNASITGGSPSNAGTIFILTDSTYPGLSTQVGQVDAAVGSGNRQWTSLGFGDTKIFAGNAGSSSSISLYGLNGSQSLPGDANAQGYALQDFAPTVIWQDQRFSNVSYTSNGAIDISSGHTLDAPNVKAPPTSPAITIGKSHVPPYFDGIVYQPRGAWIRLLSNATLTGPVKLITGSIDMQSGASLSLSQSRPLMTRTVALVE